MRQGCVISLDLFALYAKIIKQRLDHLKFTIKGVNIQNIRYVEGIVFLARSKADLENLPYILKEESDITLTFCNILSVFSTLYIHIT